MVLHLRGQNPPRRNRIRLLAVQNRDELLLLTTTVIVNSYRRIKNEETLSLLDVCETKKLFCEANDHSKEYTNS